MKTNKLRVVLATFSFLVSLSAVALEKDKDDPINVKSDNQTFDLRANTATFTGNVVVTKGTIKITADKVIVTRPGGDSRKTIVDGFGELATFYQLQDDGKPVRGWAKKMHYELEKDFIELTGNANVQQLDSDIKADRINYLIKEQQLKAFNEGDSKRVTTVLVPSQLNSAVQQGNEQEDAEHSAKKRGQ